MEPPIGRIVWEEQVEAQSFLAYGKHRRDGKGEVTVLIRKSTTSNNTTLVFLIAAAFIGLALLPLLVTSPNLASFQIATRQTIVGILFLAICLMGIAAAFYPAKCRSMFEKSQSPMLQTTKHSDGIQIKGHHPDCEHFSNNRIKIGNRNFCAACSGLLGGAVIASVGAVSYFFAGLSMGDGSVWVLGLGEAFLFFGLAQIRLAGYLKAIANLLFVGGSFVVLVEADILGSSLIADLYGLALIAFILWLRILLSEWNNRRICERCGRCV